MLGVARKVALVVFVLVGCLWADETIKSFVETCAEPSKTDRKPAVVKARSLLLKAKTDVGAAEKYTRQALELLVEPVYEYSYRHIKSRIVNEDDILDIQQNALLAISKNLSKYDPNQSFQAWISQIIEARINDHLRRVYRENNTSAPPDVLVERRQHEEEVDAEDEIAQVKSLALLVLQTYDDKRRAVLLQALTGAETYKEISQNHGLTEQTIRNWVFKYKKKLNAALLEEGLETVPRDKPQYLRSLIVDAEILDKHKGDKHSKEPEIRSISLVLLGSYPEKDSLILSEYYFKQRSIEALSEKYGLPKKYISNLAYGFKNKVLFVLDQNNIPTHSMRKRRGLHEILAKPGRVLDEHQNRREEIIQTSMNMPRSSQVQKTDPIFNQEQIDRLKNHKEEILKGLSERDRNVMSLVLDGNSYQYVASQSGASHRSVTKIVLKFKNALLLKIEEDPALKDVSKIRRLKVTEIFANEALSKKIRVKKIPFKINSELLQFIDTKISEYYAGQPVKQHVLRQLLSGKKVLEVAEEVNRPKGTVLGWKQFFKERVLEEAKARGLVPEHIELAQFKL